MITFTGDAMKLQRHYVRCGGDDGCVMCQFTTSLDVESPNPQPTDIIMVNIIADGQSKVLKMTRAQWDAIMESPPKLRWYVRLWRWLFKLPLLRRWAREQRSYIDLLVRKS